MYVPARLTLALLFFCLSLRAETAGSLDPSFGTGGVVLHSVGSGNARINDLAQYESGKIVAAGEAFDGVKKSFAVSRYQGDGSLDPSFGRSGHAIISIGTKSDYAFGVAAQHDGKILAAGWSLGTFHRMALIRLKRNGRLDEGFGAGGVVTLGRPSWNFGSYGMKLLPSGKILVLGQAVKLPEGVYHFFVACYLTDGTLDGTFGDAGIAMVPAHWGFPHGITVDGMGRIFISGHFNPDGTPDYLPTLFRFSEHGVLDTGFGVGGQVVTPLASSLSWRLLYDGVSDRILGVGTGPFDGGPNEFLVVAYHLDGTLDTSWGVNGLARATLGGDSEVAYGAAFDELGGIVLAGESKLGTDSRFALARFSRSTGAIDTSFGNAGTVLQPLGAGLASARGIVIDGRGPNLGRIVAGGTASGGTFRNFALAGFLP